MNRTLIENILCIAGGLLIICTLTFNLMVAERFLTALLFCLGIAATGYLTYRAIRYVVLKGWLERQHGVNEAITGYLNSITDVITDISEEISDTREKMGKGFQVLGDALNSMSQTRNTTKK